MEPLSAQGLLGRQPPWAAGTPRQQVFVDVAGDDDSARGGDEQGVGQTGQHDSRGEVERTGERAWSAPRGDGRAVAGAGRAGREGGRRALSGARGSHWTLAGRCGTSLNGRD